MRTTVTLDPDTEQIVRARMKAKGVSFKRALNDAIREGEPVHAKATPYVVKPRSMGVPLVDLTKANQRAAELDNADVIRKLQLGK